ncbi:MAG: hypothetical protein SF069_08505 [Phycisphaerae bacterium]|nr:hypothetical protein [Phycisphaerae bacterium]
MNSNNPKTNPGQGQLTGATPAKPVQPTTDANKPITTPKPGQRELDPPTVEGNRSDRPVTSPGISDAPSTDDTESGQVGSSPTNSRV